MDSAISELVNELERGYYQKGYTMAVFTDIEGAFDNLSFDAYMSAVRSCTTTTLLSGTRI